MSCLRHRLVAYVLPGIRPLRLATFAVCCSDLAPEILMSRPCGPAADIWSVGVITYALIGGYAPFGGEPETGASDYFSIPCATTAAEGASPFSSPFAGLICWP